LLKAVVNKDYIGRLKQVIVRLYKASATHAGAVPVKKQFLGKTIWKGDVEIFNLTGHPEAKICYGWPHPEGDDNQGERFVTILEIPPVDSPQTAVKISIIGDTKKKK
jgi:hypothetical protein